MKTLHLMVFVSDLIERSLIDMQLVKVVDSYKL